MKNKKIGLLGGIGPEATGTFYLNLIDRLQKGGGIRSNADFPQIIVNSIPAPELVYERVSDRDLSPYTEGLKDLEDARVDFIVMVCNTIHNHYDVLQSKTHVPIVDLRAEFGKFMLSKKVKSIVVLSTPTTAKGELFRVKGVDYHNLPEEELNSISQAILNFNLGHNKGEQARIVESIAKRHMDMGADLAVLGCTEVALMLKESKINKVDTMDILLDATIGRLK